MEHTHIRRMLSAYMDDAVSAGEKAAIEAHLAGCAACSKALDDLERTVAHLKSISDVEPPPWLTAKIMANVRDAAASKPSLWQRLFLPLQVKLPIEAFAILFVCVTGYYLARMNVLQAPLTTPFPAIPEESVTPAPQAQKKAPVPSKAPSPPQRAATANTLQIPQQQEEGKTYAPTPPIKAPAPKFAASATAPATVPSSPVYEPREAYELAEERMKADREASSERYNASSQTMQKRRMPVEPYYPAQSSGASTNSGAYRDMWIERQNREVWEDRAAHWNPPEQQARVEVTMRVSDPAGAAGPIELAVSRSGGVIVRRVYTEGGHLLSVRIEANRFSQLIGSLERIGTLHEAPQAPALEDGMVDLYIRW